MCVGLFLSSFSPLRRKGTSFPYDKDFMEHVEKYQNVSQPGNIMMTMGSDFNYANALPWYKNIVP